MTICEEILCISPIPKILDCRSHLLQAKPYLSPMEIPRDGLLDFHQPQAQLKASNSCTFQKRISNLIKTLADCIYRHWCYTPEKKNVHFKLEWYFSHQPDYSAFLHYHVKSAAGFLLENKLHWIRTMPEVFLGRILLPFFFFFKYF